ncbi:MAG: transcriptional regulator [Planctomycetota bacterium]|jgi:predicted Zn-ribbon and HTH transcriptional regulator
MFRKDLIELLLDNPLSVADIARLKGAKLRDVESDLRHLFRSLKRDGYRVVIEPACCRKCDFVFREEKLLKPGKCPRCKGTWIDEPRIAVERA